LDDFRKNAFIPEKPVLISNGSSKDALPAGKRWFTHQNRSSENSLKAARQHISAEYLSPFADTILPYELYSPASRQDGRERPDEDSSISSFLHEMTKTSPSSTFHRFSAPLAIFLSALTLPPQLRPNLYIAQAQLVDLPRALQDDLPTPLLVQKAGKGDIYDANIWMGIPPTYTPLHKDPNPNLFVQLASRKRVRLFAPAVGIEIFRIVQEKVRQNASSSLRGEEMMEGPEREELERAVWGEVSGVERFEATIEAGDALFIPKGWWHSIKSEGEGVNASVNWWFR
jgi:hypothetical protein